jgi:chromosome partitioning protein
MTASTGGEDIIVPVPPTALDFASLSHFWQLFADFAGNPDFIRGGGKTFAFMHIVMSRVDHADVATPAVRQWIESTYGDLLLPAEIPKSTVASAMAAGFGTAYDVCRYEGSSATYRRAIKAYDRVVGLVERSILTAWGVTPRSQHCKAGAALSAPTQTQFSF